MQYLSEIQGPCFGKPCMNGGKCIPTDNFGKYRCECVAGYIGFSCAFKGNKYCF